MNECLSEAEFEAIYDELAQAIDRVPAADENAFLARLCLLLCHRQPDAAIVRGAIADALAEWATAEDGAEEAI